MNILILSVGTRNKIVQYLKKTFEGIGNVIATDADRYAPAIYDADRYFIVPSITDKKYVDVILDICRKEKIVGVLSLIDPELSLLAENCNRFEEIGVTIIGSTLELCKMSFDKMKMYEWLVNHGYKCAESWSNIKDFFEALESNKVSFPVFVKPRCGSASVSISKVFDKETTNFLFAHEDDLMIQELLDGQEIGADVYIDMLSGDVVSIFLKKKLRMRSGETDKAISFKDNKLFGLIEKFVVDVGYRGQIDIDIFEIKGEYYINEVNPRFGGGYPHAYECGCNHFQFILNNLKGIKNDRRIGVYQDGVCMMKYNDVKTLKI